MSEQLNRKGISINFCFPKFSEDLFHNVTKPFAYLEIVCLPSCYNRCCGLQDIKYCTNLPMARIGAQVPALLAPMTDKQSLLPAKAGRLNKFIGA
jgi:hypothetical protein